MGLIVRFRLVHFRGVSAGGVCGNIRCDGILPQAETNKNMRRHMQGVGGVRCDRCIAAGSIEALRREFGAIGGVNHVVCNAGMVRMLLKQRFEDRDGFLQVCGGVAVFLGQ